MGFFARRAINQKGLLVSNVHLDLMDEVAVKRVVYFIYLWFGTGTAYMPPNYIYDMA